MFAVARNLSVLIQTIADSKDVVNRINLECSRKGLPPAFGPGIGGVIRGNKDFRLEGFGLAVDSVIPLEMSLTFWVHYRVDSDDHVELGRFSCPIRILEPSAINMLTNLSPIFLDEIVFDQRDLDESPESSSQDEADTLASEIQPDSHHEVGEGEDVISDPDPENYFLQAVQDTVLKTSPVPSPDLSESEKINFRASDRVPLISFQEKNDHIKVTLANTTLGGRKTWVAYKGHVEIADRNGTKLLGQYKVGDELPTRVNLDVPYYSQRKSRYEPSKSCNVTSVAMVLAYFGINPRSTDLRLKEQLYLEITDQGRDPNAKYWHDKLSQLIRSYGMNNRFSVSTSWDEVKTHLANGNPVIISGKFTRSGHIIVLRGYDERGFWVNDPWGEWFSSGYQNKSGENLHYSYDLCRRVSYADNSSRTWAHLPSNPNRIYHLPVSSLIASQSTSVSSLPISSALDLSKQAAKAIVNVFETGRVQGNYSTVVCHTDDLGGLTYGRSQTTINSGNLYLLIKDYCETEGAQYAQELRHYLEELEKGRNSHKLACSSNSQELREITRILRDAGSDPVMRAVQDAFFERAYWIPAMKAAAELGVNTPLGKAVVYDSFIHGSWNRMRDRTNQNAGLISRIGEQAWIKAYVDTRRQWLANHRNPLLPRTVYRMDAFKQLIRDNNWNLTLPFTVRGQRVDQAVLTSEVSGQIQSSNFRVLRLTSPRINGEDVKQVQQALKDRAYFPPEEVICGTYGPNTESKVKAFQQDNPPLKVDGIVGQQTWRALGLPEEVF